MFGIFNTKPHTIAHFERRWVDRVCLSVAKQDKLLTRVALVKVASQIGAPSAVKLYESKAEDNRHEVIYSHLQK